MENKLFAYFDFNPNKAYPIVYGATYTETFNEEINSFNIILDGVSEEDRLYFDRPYHFVKIVNDISDGETGLLFNGENSIIMLVDTFVESLNNIGGEKIYRYEIGLMNCVKLLEKIQCPNLMITHSLVDEDDIKPTIYTYIDRYMTLYCPKVKMSTDGNTWSYEYLLKWDHLSTDPKFQIAAADMQMNKPTLRQVITNLMTQVACIPVLDYRTLSYIDFREEETQANVTDTDGINFIKHSGASDSYASDLVASPSQTLQEENTVISDIVGFRDSDNAIISQTKNLQLEVRYPIYKINEVRMRTTDNKDGWFKPANENAGLCPILMGRRTSSTTSYNWQPRVSYVGEGSDFSEVWRLVLNICYAQPTSNVIFHKGRLYDIKAHLCKYDEVNDKYDEVAVATSENGIWNLNLGDSDVTQNSVVISENMGFDISLPRTVTRDDNYIISTSGYRTCNYHSGDIYFRIPHTSTGGDLSQIASHIWFEFKFYDLYDEAEYHHFIPMTSVLKTTTIGQSTHYYADLKTSLTGDNNNIAFSTLYPSSGTYKTPMTKLQIPANIGTYIDITDCIVENGKRRLLEVNYSLMQDVINDSSSELRDLAKYIYGTMGYTIGDTKITGFSDTYTRAQMWWTYTTSYFDTILSFINARKQRLQRFDYTELELTENLYEDYKIKCGYGPLQLDAASIVYINLSGSDWNTNYNKMKFLFYIYYQPLNNFKYKATKEGKEFPFSIEQLNDSADGLSDFERVIKNLQDTTNRIGNPVKSLPQTTDDITKIKPLNSIYNDGHYDFTIFSRQFGIYEKYINVNYSASENYVIKNYFTSIITKYRAYQYVDYNNSIIRKENTKVYCLISDKHYYDGDDKIRLYERHYDLNDLAAIFDVEPEEVDNYISYDDETPVDLSCLGGFCIRWKKWWYNTKWNGEPANDFFAGYYFVNEIDYARDDNSTFYTDGYFYSRTANDVWTMGTYWTSSSTYDYPANYLAVELTKSHALVRDFLNATYSSVLSTFQLNTAQLEILTKMDGSILKQGNDYYIINLISNPASDVVLENSIPLNHYVTIRNIFRRTNDRFINYCAQNRVTMEFNEDANIRLFLNAKTINIVLEKITNESTILNIIENERRFNQIFLSGFTMYPDTYNYKPKYVIKSSNNSLNEIEETKAECSLVYSNASFSVYYQDYDNVSAGPQLRRLNKETSSTNPYGVGGWVQKWQVWNQEVYGKSHQVFFTYQILMKQSNDEDTINGYIAQLPVINKGWEYQPYTLFQLVDSNKSSDLRFTFYKDNAEILNQTLEFEYYSNGDVLVGQNFVSHSLFINELPFKNSDQFVCFDISNEKFKLNEEPYNHVGLNVINEYWDYQQGKVVNDPPFSIGFDDNVNKSYIEIYWSQIPSSVSQIKFALVEEIGYTYTNIDEQHSRLEYTNSNCRDIIAFKRNGNTEDTKYYLTLNDTKTNDVWYFSDPDDLFETYKCKNYGEDGDTTGRTCKPKE